MNVLAFLALFMVAARAATCNSSTTVKNMTAWASVSFTHAQYVRNKIVGANYVFMELYETSSDGLDTAWKPVVFVLCGTTTPVNYANATAVLVPVTNVAVTEDPQFGFIKALGLVQKIAAVASPEYIDDEVLNPRVTSGAVSAFACSATTNDTCTGSGCVWEWGYCSGVNNTKLEAIDPDVVITGETMRGIVTADIATVPLPGASEPTLLAQAEYIKLFALILSADPTDAVAFFDNAVSEYKAASAIANRVGQSRPLVWTGYEYYGVWYYSQPTSYTARLLMDAGADYIFQNATIEYLPSDLATAAKTNSVSVSKLSSFYPQFSDFWYNTGINGPYNTTASVLQLVPDTGAETWRSVRCGCIFSNNKQVHKVGGANSYFWDATVRPHIVLKDMIKILHHEVDMSSYTTTFLQHIYYPNETATDCPMLFDLQFPASLPGSVNATAEVLINKTLPYQFSINFTEFQHYLAANLSVGVNNINIFSVSTADDDEWDQVRIHFDAVFMPRGRSIKQLEELVSQLLRSAARAIFGQDSKISVQPVIGGEDASSSKEANMGERVKPFFFALCLLFGLLW